jgi:hypothetical protein
VARRARAARSEGKGKGQGASGARDKEATRAARSSQPDSQEGRAPNPQTQYITHNIIQYFVFSTYIEV